MTSVLYTNPAGDRIPGLTSVANADVFFFCDVGELWGKQCCGKSVAGGAQFLPGDLFYRWPGERKRDMTDFLS